MFVETCLLRFWSDGIPALVQATRAAARRVLRSRRTTLKDHDLSRDAGIGQDSAILQLYPPPDTSPRQPMAALRDRERFAARLRHFAGDLQKMASALDVPVEQWLGRHRLTPDG
ncbi:MAG TPA: hypothetical protein VIK91_21790 [Nannocystis sp.]